MNSRTAQDVILRLLCDAPYRRSTRNCSSDATASEVWKRVDADGVERFGRFLTRHYYRERIVHLFKYSRALSGWTGRPPEAILKTDEFEALMDRAVLGSRETALAVADLLRVQQLERSQHFKVDIPYWKELVEYQCLFFVTDALPHMEASGTYPRWSAHAVILDISYDLPAILRELLHAQETLPVAEKRPVRLLFSRSHYGPVSVSTCSRKLQDLLQRLDGATDPLEAGRQLGLTADATCDTLNKLLQIGALVPGCGTAAAR